MKSSDGFIKDDSTWRKMKKNLMKGSHLAVKVGFFEDAQYGSENNNLFVAQVAQFNEEGMGVPMRSFIRSGFIPNLEDKKLPSWVFVELDLVAQGKTTWTRLYEELGEEFVEQMKAVIVAWDTPPNSARTEEEKGFNDPLVDTGLMRDSVDYRLGRK